jgi:serine/threonine-protein kinase PpkA
LWFFVESGFNPHGGPTPRYPTPQGRSNHQFAEQQYTTLSAAPFPALGPQYFPVENGDAEALSRQVRGVIAALRAIADQGQTGAAAASPAVSQNNGAAAGAMQIGHARRLAWLGRQDRATAPDVLRAWASDRYRQGEPPENLELRVLLTRNQLNDLGQVLRAIIDAGRTVGMLDSNAMFERLQSTAAALARDPERLRSRGLEQMGDLLGEFLDGLPYLTNIASIDRATWRAMSPGERDELLSELETRLRAYADFNRTPELWWPSDARDARAAGEQMFAVPLALLP